MSILRSTWSVSASTISKIRSPLVESNAGSSSGV
jgi:hypothetical protein